MEKKYMVTVQEAKDLILQHSEALRARKCALEEAAGLILAEDIIAPYHIPAYPQSSMDGYAFSFQAGLESYRLVGEMAAGSAENKPLQAGEAVRIFTGAAVPEGGDTVLMQEKARVEHGQLFPEAENMQQGDNVRPVGSEISKGSLALEKGKLLTPAAIGFIAGMGLQKLSVFPNPTVSIIVTGNELQSPGEDPQYGKVFEANSFALKAALESIHVKVENIFFCGDHIQKLSAFLERALEQSDIVLLTGGVSVGDYDFTLKAAENCGVEAVFHKIKQKPGKPIFFGTKGAKLMFGLPGNPASVLTCFYQYVLPALEKLSHRPLQLKCLKVPANQGYKKAAGLTHFLKGSYNGESVDILSGQESYKLNSFAVANCLVVVPAEMEAFKAGDIIEIQLLY